MDMLDEGVGKQGIAGPEVEDPGWVDVILWRSGMGEQRGCRVRGPAASSVAARVVMWARQAMMTAPMATGPG